MRRRVAKRTASSRVSRLEEKIDSLVSMMRTEAEPGMGMSNYAGLIAVDQPAYPSPAKTNHSSNPHIEAISHLDHQKGGRRLEHSSFVPKPVTSTDFHHPDVPLSFEAEECLTQFRTTKARYFPFVYIPPTTTAQDLRQEKPFLWLAIMAISCRSTAQQQVLGDKIKQVVAEQMVMQSEKSIDLLLGLLAFVGWANYKVHSKPFLALFTQLAVSLVFDLGLNRPVPEEAPALPSSIFKKCARPSTPRTIEERRAVLGCFLTTSIISSFLQRIDALRWTPHLEECLQVLDQEKECLGDQILVQLVRLQLIAEKGCRATPDIGNDGESDVAVMASKLEEMSVSLDNSSKNILYLHFHSIKLEIALSQASLHSGPLIALQHNSLRRGLEAITAWSDVVFAVPLADYVGFPFSILSQSVRCLTTLYRLATLDSPGWDKQHVQDTAHPIMVINRLIHNLEQASLVAGLDNQGAPEGDVFTRSANAFRSLRVEWEGKLGVAPSTSSIMSPSYDVGEIGLPDPLADDFLDNDWFMDLLTSTF
ncbi:uncharacterized protein N7459_001952 [Penicillium hispanicum]|uniref:uncharacterized protein n=1 Tax=Penicillium hispanicum TaxID=1080232 RepID=UPI0025416EAF|nr:uncharacterized protein N7459_001952 [Penicillium hispanicum]KAJ5591583.1 hypothetical protein N7459_001952 [Penicillium hispanicum]